MLEDGLVCFKRRVQIPDNVKLKLQVTHKCHDSKVASHFERDKTLELMKRNYYWLNIEDWVYNYVKICASYQYNKTECYAKYGTLKLPNIPYSLQTHIVIDFIMDLPEVKGFTQIWVIIDQFSKIAHFIPLKKTIAPQLADAFVKEEWRLYGLPTSIISNRDSLFVSKFWDTMVK